MKPALSVNAVLDELATLVGQHIALEGVLRFEFEGTALDHFPKAERRNAPDEGPLEPSSVWLSVGSGALQFNEEQLRRWDGKRVTESDFGALKVASVPPRRPAAALCSCSPPGNWPSSSLANSSGSTGPANPSASAARPHQALGLPSPAY